MHYSDELLQSYTPEELVDFAKAVIEEWWVDPHAVGINNISEEMVRIFKILKTNIQNTQPVEVFLAYENSSWYDHAECDETNTASIKHVYLDEKKAKKWAKQKELHPDDDTTVNYSYTKMKIE